MKSIRILLVSLIGVLTANTALAQYTVKGTVYDSSRQYRIPAVTVMSSAGNITITDSIGNYKISVSERDSVWFSYLGKSTPKYAVLKMADISQFDISLQLKPLVMEEVRIKSRSYRMDSLQNRLDYAKVFDYKKVSFGSMTSIGPGGAAFDLQEIIRLFQFRKNRSMLKFQQRLLEQEREKYIDHRFNRTLITKLTELKDEQLERFMIIYRPTYEFVTSVSEYDFQLYIKSAGTQFRKSL